MTTFRNTFHNAEITIKANIGDTVSKATERKVTKALCGVSGCECGTFRGSSARIEEIGYTKTYRVAC